MNLFKIYKRDEEYSLRLYNDWQFSNICIQRIFCMYHIQSSKINKKYSIENLRNLIYKTKFEFNFHETTKVGLCKHEEVLMVSLKNKK